MSPYALADSNLIEAVREHGRWQEPSERREEDGVLLLAAANAAPLAFRNCVIRTDSRVAAAQVLDRAREFFALRGRGFTVMVSESRDRDLADALRAAGVAEAGDAPCMLIESPLAEPALPAGVTVERFDSERHLADAVRINAEAYEMIKLPAEQTRLYFRRASELLSPRVAGFVAYRDGMPAATALAILSGDSAGVYWVGTVAAAQRSGLAELCTRLATNAGFASGARVVTLQASAFGVRLYARLGYRTYDRMIRFRHT
jgi:hypothetical protein